jgi:hypothetical protein
MGSGTWSAKVYDRDAKVRMASGASAFNYTDSGLHHDAHPAMDARGLDGKGAKRESRDSDEHPVSTAITVWFDHTGSMGAVPRRLQEKLPQLLGLLLRKGYVVDPQIMFAAVGDATVDRAPLQVGQFESDNRMDDDLGNLLLEGGGGGGMSESYELALYFMARRTAADCWDKRGKRGYMIIVGDEMAYRRVSRREVASFIGDTIQADIPFEEILAEVTERWDGYYIMPGEAGHAGHPEVRDFWRGALGQNFIEVGATDAIPETIALTIGIAEGTTDLDAGLTDLGDVGSAAGTVVGNALAPLAASGGGGKGVAVAPPPGDLDAPSGNTRL